MNDEISHDDVLEWAQDAIDVLRAIDDESASRGRQDLPERVRPVIDKLKKLITLEANEGLRSHFCAVLCSMEIKMDALEKRMARIEEEEQAFLRMRASLLQRYRSGYVVIHGGQLCGRFEDNDDAFRFALKKFGRNDPFLIRDIVDDPTIEAPALVMGLMHKPIT